MVNEPKWAKIPETSKHPDGSYRYVAELANMFPEPKDPVEYIRVYRSLPAGKFTFAGGMWYAYKEVRFSFDSLGAARSFTVRDYANADPDYFSHEFLAAAYPKILKAQRVIDPIYERRRGASHLLPDTLRTRRLAREAVVNWLFVTENGWHVRIYSAGNVITADGCLGDIRALIPLSES